ncbi:hypothetical protein GPY51_20615 [Photorhabdus laumondii subsp. laumondii]|uniref:Transposase DDE domain-containing protein n=1 Tax=Photorhabdus laumondii subsp. laumondii TaxID=141679 RepID=A0A6L9JWP8_PHOLM|nr:transposase [Photorhabdus laumondii]RAW65948.1 hypothetical protein CKY15_20990 [Photorhabdus sp. S7-51]RAW67697.1 hypothetical protein CKY14_20940 [Photorhabdus sp. S14-60]RAW72571.1 hypothetical protein CKY06_21075 [Photorhabdus sp. S15-56]RAW80242.1 hypothetical protein CKY09_21255 [Photorhabdus sp. S5P8-50]RAW80269.1 hypothetical protein CKY12_21595 [Photorhabdus sp. S12-55]
MKRLSGYGDKGYLSQALCEDLAVEGVTLVTNIPKKLQDAVFST